MSRVNSASQIALSSSVSSLGSGFAPNAVDVAFFKSMGKMHKVDDVSNCDIVWCLVDFEQQALGLPYELKVIDPSTYITLGAAIEGLSGGDAVSLREFKSDIPDKIDDAP
ncbi:hypothetical protein NHG85_04400 [Limimaricola sp. ASW11-118]|uniref:Restriction endonuclease type II NotI domain-containing protein n=2 Tax=Limimaricola litoreus TaxID=2955316 RepID=A0A9X2JMV1_9RHOB|nr:hypothetical protein [Limimaricola litoreus]